MNGPTRVLDWVVVILSVGAAYTFLPLWAPLVLAAWVAAFLAPLLRKLSADRHKKRSAALLTTALVVTVLIPLALLLMSLTAAAAELVRGVLESKGQPQALRRLILESSPSKLSLDQLSATQLMQLLRNYGQSAATALGAVAGATTKIVIGAAVFVLSTYALLVDGSRLYAWLADHAVMQRKHCDRLAGAFLETGRGLLIGTGLTALIQGALATVGYVALGIPRPLVLGFVTSISALIPSVGTGLVWVPVCIGLWIADRYAAAIVMLSIGIVISITDNFVRPALARFGALRLPTMIVFVAMLGGIGVFGAWGLVLGPLFVRLAVEGLAIVRESRKAGAGVPRGPTPPCAANPPNLGRHG